MTEGLRMLHSVKESKSQLVETLSQCEPSLAALEDWDLKNKK